MRVTETKTRKIKYILTLRKSIQCLAFRRTFLENVISLLKLWIKI